MYLLTYLEASPRLFFKKIEHIARSKNQFFKQCIPLLFLSPGLLKQAEINMLYISFYIIQGFLEKQGRPGTASFYA